MKKTLYIILSVVIFITLLPFTIYLPPVQQWAVKTACDYASEAMDMNISIEKVKLSFPIDICLETVKATKQNDSLPQKTDTIANVKRAVVDVKLWPLLNNEIKVKAVELLQAKINTSDFIHEARIKGFVGRMAIENNPIPVLTVNLNNDFVDIASIILDNAKLNIELSDTVLQDTTKTETTWKIKAKALRITNSELTLHMPNDTIQVGAKINDLTAHNGFFDLKKGLYELSTISLNNSYLTYDNCYEPKAIKGIDPNHIKLENINLKIDSIHYCEPDIRLLIKQCSMKEKSGLELSSLVANICIDSTLIKANGTLKTPASTLTTKVEMGLNAFSESEGTIKAFIDASIGRQDMMLALAEMPAPFRNAWPMYPLNIKGEAMGNMSQITIPWLSMEMPSVFSLDANGNALGFMNLMNNPYSKDFKARLHSDLKTYNLSFVKSLLDRNTSKNINIPSMKAMADIYVSGADYDILLKAQESKGTLEAKAKANIASLSYNLDVKSNNLNIGHFVKGMQLGSFTGSIYAAGQGTDIKSNRTKVNANANLKHFSYGRYNLDNIHADANVKNGKINMLVTSKNELIDGNIGLNALIDRKFLDATITTELNNADLYKLSVVDVPLNFSVCGHLDIKSDFNDFFKLQGMISDITLIDSAKVFRPDDIIIDVLTNKDTTLAKTYCGDFELRLNAHGGYKKLLTCSESITKTIQRQLNNRTINQKELRALLPIMNVHLTCSDENPIYSFIRYFNFEYSKIHADFKTSPAEGINGGMQIEGLTTEGYKLDTLVFSVNSTEDEIAYNGHIQNTKPNQYVFDIFFNGKLLEHGISLDTEFYDANDELGLKLGTIATITNEGIKLTLTPSTPILGYQEFNLNDDNYLLFQKDGRVKGYIDLKATDGTGMKIYTADDEEALERLQDITLSVNKINIGKILAVIPYAPQADGMINGDIHFVQEIDRSFSLSTDLDIDNLSYEGNKMGNVGIELTYMPKSDGFHYIDGHMTLNDEEVTNITGSYNFDTGIFDSEMAFIRFPMEMVNGFIPDKIIGFEGYAEGTVSLVGTSEHPLVNGELFLESASLVSVPYGIKLRFDDDPVRIIKSQLLLENFNMYASNDSPLLSYGYIDFSDTEHINMDLMMKAENFLLIDAKETRRSEAYGKGYFNFFAYMRGELSKLQVRGNLDVLPTTDLYYILRDSPINSDNRLKELVKFTDFNSEEPLAAIRPTIDGINVDFTVNVESGAHIKCWLDDIHSNFLDIIGDGELRMKYKEDKLSLTGLYTINEGEMKFSLPIISLQSFNIESGSYIEFNGDMMNPRLNVTALKTNKAPVNIEGQSKMVLFNNGVKLSKTLKDMGLEFIIEAPEDQNIADELKMLSTEERSKMAITMLTTGMYLSENNTSSFTMNSALNSYLQSEINNLAGSALKTLDLSVGIENTTEEDGTIHTNYSFKFAKRFWNNRLSVSIGGNISSGPDQTGRNKAFFDNIEMQYRLSDLSNQYLRAFYKNSVYDYLEGYVGQFGAGYMWKKKVQSLNEIFSRPKTINTQYNKPVLSIPTREIDTTTVNIADTLKTK